MLELKLHSNPKKHVYSRISNPARKAAYLFALCAQHPLYSKHKNHLGGILDMLNGLDYHIKRIRTYEKAACRFESNLNALSKTKEPFNLSDLSKRAHHHPAGHEAVAYIGRLGQLCYFFTSKWFRSAVGKKDIALTIPSILALMPVRNKHSAHRQQDAPREEDDLPCLGFNEYGLKHTLVPYGREPENVNIQYSFPTKQRNPLLEKYHPSPVSDVERIGGNNLVIFTPTKIHQKIANEAISLLELFFGFQP